MGGIVEFSLNKHKSLEFLYLSLSLSSHLPHLSDGTIHDRDPGGGISNSHYGRYINYLQCITEYWSTYRELCKTFLLSFEIT